MLEWDSGTFTGTEAWQDITPDASAIEWTIGHSSGDLNDRTAAPGTLSFYLDNSATNSFATLAKYSPPDYWDVGYRVRLRMQHGGDYYGVPLYGAATYGGETWCFIGRIKSIAPTAGTLSDRRARVIVGDFMDALSTKKVERLDVQQTIKSEAAAQAVIANLIVAPEATSYGTGQETFTYFGDDMKDERTTALAALDKIAKSEFGYIYTKPNGTFTFENRHARRDYSGWKRTFADADWVSLDVSRDIEDIINRAEVTTNPRTVGGSPETLWSLATAVAIPASGTAVITGRYTDPNQQIARISGMSMQPMVAGTHYDFSSGTTGSDLTLNITVTPDWGANAVEFTIVNNVATPGYVTMLKAIGTAVRMFDPVVNKATDSDSQDDYDLRLWQYDMPYQVSTLTGQAIADAVLAAFHEPFYYIRSMSWVPDTASDLADAFDISVGDGIKITSALHDISEKEVYVNGVHGRILNQNTVVFDYVLAFAFTGVAWMLGIVGKSEIGTNTYLGF
jgi:hypothetical protein